MLFYLFTDTFKVPSPGLYSPEKVHPQGERHAPQYSISARTKMRRIDPNPAPNQYTLPPIIGSKQPNKPAAPAYVMTNRTEVLYSDQNVLFIWCTIVFYYIITIWFFISQITFLNILYMSILKEIYEILQLHVCLNFMEITVFFRGGLLFSYTSYKVYSTLWSSLCCSTLKLEIKTLDPKLFLMVLFELKSVCVGGGGLLKCIWKLIMHCELISVHWISRM